MNTFTSEQTSINEKKSEELKDGCLSYLEKLLAPKDKNT